MQVKGPKWVKNSKIEIVAPQNHGRKISVSQCYPHFSFWCCVLWWLVINYFTRN